MAIEKWSDSTFLVDANYIAYRGLYGLFQAPITEIENAMFYGFTKTLVALGKGLSIEKEKLRPKNIILCWDSKHSYRRMLYPQYKQRPTNLSKHQEKVLETLKVSFPRLRMWMKRINIPSFLCAGYEADDIIAGFTKQYPQSIYKFIIISRDEDLYQLLSPSVAMYKMVKKEKRLYTIENFMDAYGIHPSSWHIVKAIGGCTSDHIPGVKGVGEKTAIKYLAGEATAKTVKKIESSKQETILYETLTKLPLDNTRFRLNIHKKEPNWDAFTKFCQIYNFKSFVIKFREVMEALT